MTKAITIVNVGNSLTDEGGESIALPSHFFILNALGHYIFFKTRSREAAQNACDKEYGKGHYRIRTI